MNRWSWVVLLLLLTGAIGLRWPLLGHRPLHNDEAVNAVKFGQLWNTGVYRYDPNEHHGPTLYYATWALGKLTRAGSIDEFSDARLRWVPAIFGLGMILLLPLVAAGLGRQSAGWAGLFTAVSPALVFYSNNFIHESILGFATFLAIGAGWQYWQKRSIGWALVAGSALGLMQATKETFVLTLGAAGVALAVCWAWERWIDATNPPVKRRSLPWKHVAAGLVCALVVSGIFMTSFLTNLSGMTDAVATFFPWVQRAAGDSPHIHPWHFFLHRLLWFQTGNGPVGTELLIFGLALVGVGSRFIRVDLRGANAGLVRFLGVYTFALLTVYSLIPYKTPWCLLSFWHGAILLAGVGASRLILGARSLGRGIQCLLVAGVLVGAAHLAWQAWRGGSTFAADRRNPYVYSQTSPNLMQLVHRVEALGQVHPDGYRMLIKVICPESDYWPLPWYLRRFQRVGYWDALPPDPVAPVIIVAAPLDARLDEGDAPRLMTGYTQLRPGVFLETYIDLELWKAYLEKNPPKRDTE